MKLIKELLEAVSKDAAAKVYHRDYLKTKKKPYRAYRPEKRAKTTESVDSFQDILNEYVDNIKAYLSNKQK